MIKNRPTMESEDRAMSRSQSQRFHHFISIATLAVSVLFCGSHALAQEEEYETITSEDCTGCHEESLHGTDIAEDLSHSIHRDFERGTYELFFSRPVRKLALLGGRFVGSLTVSVLIFVGPILGIVIGSQMPWIDPEQLGPFMLALGIAQPFLQLHFTLGGAHRGAGDTWTPLMAALVGNWVFRVPLAILFARTLDMPLIWVWGALILDHVARSGWLGWSFRSGRWHRRSGLSATASGEATTR